MHPESSEAECGGAGDEMYPPQTGGEVFMAAAARQFFTPPGLKSRHAVPSGCASDHAVAAQLRDLLGAQAGLLQHLVGVLTE